ncbi:MAG: response regulator, partial [Akkermansiaceae bacterium]|nr:response regulator [Akkermansiaceae bacterium]
SIHSTLSRLFPQAMATDDAAMPVAENLDTELPAGLKVRVAEDNLNNQKVIKLLLRRIGIEADITSDGREAVEAATGTEYDVILLDVQMPVMDGLEASRIIRGMNHKNKPYILAISANVFQEDRDAAAAAGMDDYLAKPITLDKLRAKLLSISQKRARLQVAVPSPADAEAEAFPGLLDLKIVENLSFLGRSGCAELVDDAARESIHHLISIRDSIEHSDSTALKEQLHKFRGMLLQIGAHALPMKLQQLEHHTGPISPGLAIVLHDELASMWEATRAAILSAAESFPEDD